MGELARAQFVCIECIGRFGILYMAGIAIYYRGTAGKAEYVTTRPQRFLLDTLCYTHGAHDRRRGSRTYTRVYAPTG